MFYNKLCKYLRKCKDDFDTDKFYYFFFDIL
jgi:hypothetical protein